MNKRKLFGMRIVEDGTMLPGLWKFKHPSGKEQVFTPGAVEVIEAVQVRSKTTDQPNEAAKSKLGK